MTGERVRDKKLASAKRDKDQIFEGLHEAIIPQSLFDQVQELLKSKSRENSVLAGLIFDEKGHKFYPAHATKKMATPTDGGSVAKSWDARE